MNYLYLDIETIPAQSPEAHEAVAATVKPPAAMKKAETIAAWEKNDKAQAVKDAVAKTSLDGTYGHICCIGFALDDIKPDCRYLADRYTPELEADLLRDFFAEAGRLIERGSMSVCIVGHNVVAFDLRFIWQRAIILGVKVPQWFPRDLRPWNGDIFDTMIAFAGYRGMVGMDRLSAAMGLPGKGEINGSMIASLWEAQRSDDIARYCMEDVERTRAIHRRMMIAYGEAA